MRIGWHSLGVLAMAVSLTDSHGHPEDGKSVAPKIEKGDDPAHSSATPLIRLSKFAKIFPMSGFSVEKRIDSKPQVFKWWS